MHLSFSSENTVFLVSTTVQTGVKLCDIYLGKYITSLGCIQFLYYNEGIHFTFSSQATRLDQDHLQGKCLRLAALFLCLKEYWHKLLLEAGKGHSSSTVCNNAELFLNYKKCFINHKGNKSY